MSRTADTLYLGNNTSQRVKPVSLIVDEGRNLSLDLSAYCGIEGTTISSATWALENSYTGATIGTPTTTTKTSTALVTGTERGCGTIEVSLSMANSETIVCKFRLKVTDPQAIPLTDYQSA